MTAIELKNEINRFDQVLYANSFSSYNELVNMKYRLLEGICLEAYIGYITTEQLHFLEARLERIYSDILVIKKRREHEYRIIDMLKGGV